MSKNTTTTKFFLNLCIEVNTVKSLHDIAKTIHLNLILKKTLYMKTVTIWSLGSAGLIAWFVSVHNVLSRNRFPKNWMIFSSHFWIPKRLKCNNLDQTKVPSNKENYISFPETVAKKFICLRSHKNKIF